MTFFNNIVNPKQKKEEDDMKYILKIFIIMLIMVLATAFFIDNVVGSPKEDRKTIACVNKCDNAQDKCYASAEANRSCNELNKCDVIWRACLKKCGYTEKYIDWYTIESENDGPCPFERK